MPPHRLSTPVIARGYSVYLDQLEKPVVAAVNGMALGGGAELALRCHDRVSTSRAVFQFPEVTLGILPGIGGLVIPYRKWPAAAETFTKMLTQNERLTAKQAVVLGVVSAIEDEYEGLVQAAAARARELVGKVPLQLPDPAGLNAGSIPALEAIAVDGTPLSKEVVEIILQAVRHGIEAPDLASALEVGYQAFGTGGRHQGGGGRNRFILGRSQTRLHRDVDWPLSPAKETGL